MFKKILQSSARTLLERPSLIRLWFLTLVCFSIVRLYYIVYYFNNILIWKYESWVQISDALIYFITTLNEHHAIAMVIILVLIIIVWYLWLCPIWEAAVINSLKYPDKSNFFAFRKGISRFFPMLEYWWLSIPFGLFTFLTVVLRLYLIEILDSIVVEILVWIWGSMVIFASIFWSYARTIIALEWVQVFDAIKKSTSLAFSHLWLSIKLMVVEFLLLFRFLIIWVLIVWIPLGLVYLAVWMDILDNAFVEIIIWVIAWLLLLVVSYVNCIVETFFLTYWYKAYTAILEDNEEDE